MYFLLKTGWIFPLVTLVNTRWWQLKHFFIFTPKPWGNSFAPIWFSEDIPSPTNTISAPPFFPAEDPKSLEAVGPAQKPAVKLVPGVTGHRGSFRWVGGPGSVRFRWFGPFLQRVFRDVKLPSFNGKNSHIPFGKVFPQTSPFDFPPQIERNSETENVGEGLGVSSRVWVRS